MLKIAYNNANIEIPLDTKISEISNVIEKQINTKNIYYKLYFNNEPIIRTPHNVFIDETNKDMKIYEIYAKLKSTLEDSKSYARNNRDIYFPKTQTSISFERTIRVPVDNKSYPLPPTLGKYNLMNIDNECILPMYQCEAMWMKFKTEKKNIAIKIGCGDVNIISGGKWQDNVLTQNPQNYIILPEQLWLDGIKTKTNKIGHYVRQFVAMPLHDDSTIEKQMKNKGAIQNIHGDIKFEVFDTYKKWLYREIYYPTIKKYHNFMHIEKTFSQIDANQLIIYTNGVSEEHTLYEYGIRENDKVCVGPNYKSFQLFVKTLLGKTITLNDITHYTTIEELKNQIYNRENIPVDQQRLIFAGKQLEDLRTVYNYSIESEEIIWITLRLRGGGGSEGNVPYENEEKNMHMGLAVGGLIEQKIYKDKNKIADYDIYNIEKFMLKIYNGQELKSGLPYTPISMQTYLNLGYQWFQIYDEKIPAITNKIDLEPVNITKITNLEMCDVCMDKYSNIEYHPCKHKICSVCFVKQTDKNKDLQCHMCRENIETSQVKLLSDIIDIDNDDLDEFNVVDNIFNVFSLHDISIDSNKNIYLNQNVKITNIVK